MIVSACLGVVIRVVCVLAVIIIAFVVCVSLCLSVGSELCELCRGVLVGV